MNALHGRCAAHRPESECGGPAAAGRPSKNESDSLHSFSEAREASFEAPIGRTSPDGRLRVRTGDEKFSYRATSRRQSSPAGQTISSYSLQGKIEIEWVKPKIQQGRTFLKPEPTS